MVNQVNASRGYALGLLPGAILVGLFFIAPAIWAIYASFSNLALIGAGAANPHSVGLQNYLNLFRDPVFFTSVVNSIVFVIGSAVIGQFVLGLLLALLLDYAEKAHIPGGNVVYAAVLMAWVTPSLIGGFLWVAMFDYYYGSLNGALHFIGLPSVDWLGKAPMLSVIIANTWQGTAFSMLVLFSAIKTIPASLYEAAQIDGASAWRQFWDMTVPELRYIALLILLDITIATFGSFILILMLTNGGPGIATEVISLYAYHTAFNSFEIGYGSAIAVVMLLINLAFAGAYLLLLRPKT